MRTTVRIDDDLLRELKDRAHREETSLSKLLNRVIRLGMTKGNGAPVKSRPFRQKTYDMGPPNFDVTKAWQVAEDLETAEMIESLRRIERQASGR
jgi:hypothetical protein